MKFPLFTLLVLVVSQWAMSQQQPAQHREIVVGNKTAIDALLWFGELCSQPLGMIASDKTIASAQISLNLANGDCDDAFARILQKIPNYKSERIDGVLVIQPAVRDPETEELFTTVIPKFGAVEATTGQLSDLLWMEVQLRNDPTIRGFAGIRHTKDHTLLAAFDLRDATVQQVLNEIVRRRRSAAWVGFHPIQPSNGAPRQMPWNIIAYEVPPAPIEDLCCLDRSNLPTK